MQNITAFDTQANHIHFVAYTADAKGKRAKLRAVLDTGAPFTEFSDQFLHYAELIENPVVAVQVKPNLQTQKYSKLLLPQIEICGHSIQNLTVFVSRFEKHWGVDALIGLDFFRKFRVTVDYENGHLLTESFLK